MYNVQAPSKTPNHYMQLVNVRLTLKLTMINNYARQSVIQLSYLTLQLIENMTQMT